MQLPLNNNPVTFNLVPYALAVCRLNATRLAMLVTRPVVSHLTDTMWDFSNSSAVYMHFFPQLAGQTVAGEGNSCRLVTT
jgi:hypothetical protein